MKDKEIIKETLKDFNMTTPLETGSALSNISNSYNKQGFFKTAGDAMTAYVAAVKEQNDYCSFVMLPSPEKIAKTKGEVLLEELEM
jgi:hypothetical protein